MKKLRIVLYCLLVLNCTSCSGFTKSKMDCDIQIVVYVHKNIKTVTSLDIQKLLASLNKKCKDNAEFSEFSNEVLFELMVERTEDVLKIIDNTKHKLDREYLYNNLADPVKDFDLQGIMNKVKVVNCSDAIKKRVIDSLKIAASKN